MLNTETKRRDSLCSLRSARQLTTKVKRERRSIYSGSAVSIAVVNIRNLRLRTYIGFNPEERVKQQDVVINIEINYAVNQGVLDDQVHAALDYKVIAKAVIKHVEDGHFMLLEKLTSDVLSICANHPDVNHARVSIDKPNALRFADSVSLTLEHNADARC